MAKSKNIMDYYKLFNLDRNMDDLAIKKDLRDTQKKFMRRQSTTQDEKELKEIMRWISILDDAIVCFKNKDSRAKYDKALDAAYQNGSIRDEAVVQAKDALEKAKQFFFKENYKFASKFAMEAINNKTNDPAAYEILAKCYFSSGDYAASIDTIDKALLIFKDNDDFLWLSARFNSVAGKYEDAQQKINRMLELNPGSTRAHTEQILLYMYAQKKDIAFQQIDQYVEKNPGDNEFKRETAYNLLHFANSYYVEDPASGSMVIIDKKSYTEFLALSQKAYRLYKDDVTESYYKRAKYFGKKEFNHNNASDLGWLWGVSILCIIGMGMMIATRIGMNQAMASMVVNRPAPTLGVKDFLPFIIITLIYIVPTILLTIVSFRPHWKIHRQDYTGRADIFETIVIWWGRIVVGIIRIGWKLTWGLIEIVLSFF